MNIPPKLLYQSQQNENISLCDALEPLPLTELPSVTSYDVGDQSIEAPPYSPITPRIVNKMVKVASIISTTPLMPGESHIEAPDLFPQTQIGSIPTSPFPSPGPPMSPKYMQLMC